MKSKDIFGLMIRFFGLVFLFQGLVAVPTAWAIFCPVFPHFLFRHLFSCLLMVGWPLAVGCCLVMGAPRLANIAYAREESALKKETT